MKYINITQKSPHLLPEICKILFVVIRKGLVFYNKGNRLFKPEHVGDVVAINVDDIQAAEELRQYFVFIIFRLGEGAIFWKIFSGAKRWETPKVSATKKPLQSTRAWEGSKGEWVTDKLRLLRKLHLRVLLQKVKDSLLLNLF